MTPSRGRGVLYVSASREGGVLYVYRELALLEEEEECLRRRAGDRLLRRGGVRRRGDLDFCRPPDLNKRQIVIELG